MPTAKESAKSNEKDLKDKNKAEEAEEKEQAESQDIDEVPEGDAPTPADEVGTGKAESQEKVHEATEDGPVPEGEKPASEPVTETKTNTVSVDQADQHIYTDAITPGGTQQNNPTPNPKVKGDSYVAPKTDKDEPEALKTTKSGVFTYEWDRNKPEFYINRPEDAEVSSAVGVIFEGDDVPVGMYSAYYANEEEGIVHTVPVDVTQHLLHVVLPVALEEMAGEDPIRMVILDNNGEQIALSKPFTI